MPKANRTCYCCGRKYYYCPSCNDDRRDPKIYAMFDSELCKEIFSALTDETFKKITTSECKGKLIKLGVNENMVLNAPIRKHADKVMSYKEVIKPVIESVKNDIEEVSIVLEETKEDNVEDIAVKTSAMETPVVEVEEIEVTTVENELKTENYNYKKNKRTRKSPVRNIENSEVD